MDTFIEQYFSSKETVNALKAHFNKDIQVILVVKDAEYNILKYERNIRTIDNYIKLDYTR